MFQASYQQVAELLLQLQFSSHDLLRFCEQLAFSVMVRNGDAYLKNFGVLDRLRHDIWFAPMFDVVTIICKYAQYPGGRNWRIQRGGYNVEDTTLALKLSSGKQRTKSYPTHKS